MKKIVFIAFILIGLGSIAQTWQYSLNNDHIGFRNKIGVGEQKAQLIIKSFDGKNLLNEQIVINSDEWKDVDLHQSYPKVFNANKTYLLKVELVYDKVSVVEVDYAYNSYQKEDHNTISFKDLPEVVQSSLVGEFVEGNIYRTNDGINYYVGQRLQDGSKPLVEWVYTISLSGKITEYEIKR